MVLSDQQPLEMPVAETPTPDTARAAFAVLRVGFTVLPIVVGVDKFFDRLVDWTQYLWSGVPNTLHISPTTFMHGAGVVEITAGVLVLVVPQVGGAVVAAWLAGIVTNLMLVGFDEHQYWDVALRDFALLIGAIALVLLATRYSPVVGRTGKERPSGRRRDGPTVGP
jgi:uncharacterized membrane protein YphA (DoxX/SURF4 family)